MTEGVTRQFPVDTLDVDEDGPGWSIYRRAGRKRYKLAGPFLDKDEAMAEAEQWTKPRAAP